MQTQNTELAKVKARIRALANKTTENGCSEHEAMSAMSMVGQLLTQYNLTMDEIDVRDSICVTIKIPVDRQRRHPIDGCITPLANLFGAKCWFSKEYHPQTYKKMVAYAFFGYEQDMELIKYLYDVIWKAMETESANFKLTDVYKNAHPKKSAYVSFQHGMSYRVASRLRVLKAENDRILREAEERAKANRAQSDVVLDLGSVDPSNPIKSGMALVVLKGQLIEQEFKKTGPKLRKHTSTTVIRNGSAYSSGHQAGDRVNLNRPLAGRSNAGYLR